MEEKKFKHLRCFIWNGTRLQIYKGDTHTVLVYDDYARGLGKSFDESVVLRMSHHLIFDALVVFLKE